jgi:hypothetical protein
MNRTYNTVIPVSQIPGYQSFLSDIEIPALMQNTGFLVLILKRLLMVYSYKGYKIDNNNLLILNLQLRDFYTRYKCN